MYALGHPSDIHDLFFTDKQHQDENGMIPHIMKALEDAVHDRCGSSATAKWSLFQNRFKYSAMQDVFGVNVPREGWDTVKLHSKVNSCSTHSSAFINLLRVASRKA